MQPSKEAIDLVNKAYGGVEKVLSIFIFKIKKDLNTLEGMENKLKDIIDEILPDTQYKEEYLQLIIEIKKSIYNCNQGADLIQNQVNEVERVIKVRTIKRATINKKIKNSTGAHKKQDELVKEIKKVKTKINSINTQITHLENILNPNSNQPKTLH